MVLRGIEISGCESVERSRWRSEVIVVERQTPHLLLLCRDLWQFVSRATILRFSTGLVQVLTPAQLRSAPS
jgi:hypothetical protein